jgi:hypothetical protein
MARYSVSTSLGRGVRVNSYGGGAVVFVIAVTVAIQLLGMFVFVAMLSLLLILAIARALYMDSSVARRRVAEPYFKDYVAWDKVDLVLPQSSIPVWAVYAVGDSFFTGRHPERQRQLHALYPERAERMTAVAAFPTCELARRCAKGLFYFAIETVII